MTLRYSLERRMAGHVCAAAQAFHVLQREVAMLGSRDTWMWFADRFGALETSLSDSGGFDENLADYMETSQPQARFLVRQTQCPRSFDVVSQRATTLRTRYKTTFPALLPKSTRCERRMHRNYASACTIELTRPECNG